ESRVRSILDPNARRRGVNGLKVALAAVIAAVLTAPLAMLQPWRNAEASARMDHTSVNLANPTSLPFPAKLSNLNNLVQPIENLKNEDQDQGNKARESEELQKQIGEGQGTGQGQGQGAGQGQGKSGELTVEQLVEMKAVGVTPEYIESIRKLGYGELTVKQAI